MKHHQKHERSPELPEPCFKTPNRPSPPATSMTSKSTTSTETKSRISTPGRSWKGSLLPGSARAQSTLTQIDFVTQATQSDDGQLDYIDTSRPRENTLQNQAPSKDDRFDNDTDNMLSTRAISGTSTFGKNDDHPKRRRQSAVVNSRAPEQGHSLRKSQTPRTSLAGKGKRKSAQKSAAKRDKTLTQMDFVRRYITIDDENDDDLRLGYIQESPQHGPDRNGQKTPATKEMNLESTTHHSAKRQRRNLEAEIDLSTGEPISDTGNGLNGNRNDVPHDPLLPDAPVTPHKSRKLEIPSSQSPESPGLAIITSSQFRSATRSPLKQKSSNFAHDTGHSIKEESPINKQIVENPKIEGHKSPRTTSALGSPKSEMTPTQQPSNLLERLASLVPSSRPGSQRQSQNDSASRLERRRRERTVVYETDAETDDSDPENVNRNPPATPNRAHEIQGDGARPVHQTSALPIDDDDSYELPLPGVESPVDLGSPPESEAPMSDASLFYQRMQPATQFPHEPIPALNTQKLSELFPYEGSTQYNKPGPEPGFSQRIPGPFLQTQTQSQEADQTEIVPESSPAREQENSIQDKAAAFQRPYAPDSVVQVESSQPVDGIHNRARKVSSRSQLLTSSVMESVPLPQFCMSSQDSVGEPYNLQDQ